MKLVARAVDAAGARLIPLGPSARAATTTCQGVSRLTCGEDQAVVERTPRLPATAAKNTRFRLTRQGSAHTVAPWT